MAEPGNTGSGLTPVRSELILGGQKSGKSRRAEALARSWIDGAGGRQAVLIATATASDSEMRARIERHRADRAHFMPALVTVQEPLALVESITRHSTCETLVIVDCLTLWLTNLSWPGMASHGAASGSEDMANVQPAIDTLARAISAAPGPLVLVSNEIGLGVIPLGREVRAFVDALGQLNQAAARRCDRVTLMAAGLAMALKGMP